jgi:hypothetical protein
MQASGMPSSSTMGSDVIRSSHRRSNADLALCAREKEEAGARRTPAS